MKASITTRLGTAAVVAAALLGLATALLVHTREDSRFHDAQDTAAARAAEHAESVTAQSLRQLSTAAAFFEASNTVTRAEFAILAQSLLAGEPLSATSFTQRVTLAQRARYEQEAGFPIVERSIAGYRRATRRFTYFPVTFAASELEEAPPLGFDAATDDQRGAAMRRARDSGETAVTGTVPLIRGRGRGLVAYAPIYDPDLPGRTINQRRRALEGFAVGVFRTDDLLAAARSAAPESAAVLMRGDDRGSFGQRGALDDGSTADLRIGDRRYTLALRDPDRPSVTLPLAAGGAGLLLAGMIAALLAGWARRERYASQLVDQRLAERDAAEAQRREADRRYRLLADNATDMVTIHDRKGRILYASPSCEALLGHSPEEMVGRSVREYIHAEDVERLAAYSEELLASGEAMTLECRLRNRAGEYTWVEASARAVTDPASGVTEIQASARDVSERMRMQAELELLADQDPLTGLKNRRRFEEDLETELRRARRDQGGGALVVLDLDYFKRVNDTLGHQAGDLVLKAVARVLEGRIRESDVLARLGGDEFAIILPRTREREARIVGEAISAAIREHDMGPAGAPRMTASIGIAVFDPDPRATVATVMSEADMAMYAAKQAGRDSLRVFDFERDASRPDPD